jgi:Protein of unknown function (DUF4199)
MENQVTSHIIKGVILSAVSIVFAIIVYVFNLYEMSALSYINYAIFLGGLIYGAILYAKQNNHNVTFGNVFAHGFKTTAVVIVITSIYTIIAVKFLFPDMVDKAIEISRKKMAENPKMTDEMIEQSLAMVKKFFIPFALGGTIIGTGLLGAIGAAIGAGIAKKNPNPFSDTAS